MIIDLDTLRPKNETYEHFLLKQVGRAFLFEKGFRQIACEVHLQGFDSSPYGKKKVTDIAAIQRKRKTQPSKEKLYSQILEIALVIGEPLRLTDVYSSGKRYFINTYSLRGPEKFAKKASIELCYEKACEQMGLPKETYKKLQNPYEEEYLLASIECKQSLQDFRQGFCVTAEHSYIIAPKNLIPLEEIPNKVGLLEFDFDKFYRTKKWETALTVKKRPKKQYDSMFFENNNPKKIDIEKHKSFCNELVYSIAQESTEETIFWNPFLRNVSDRNEINSNLINRFKYNIGDVTPCGVVIDRKIGEKTEEEIEFERKFNRSMFHSRYTAYYKLVIINEGITSWIPQYKIIENI